MARKSQRLRRQRRVERMKAREQQNSTPVEDNSVMIQKVLEVVPQEIIESTNPIIDTLFGVEEETTTEPQEIIETQENPIEEKVVEELIEIEKEIINLFENSVIEPEPIVAPKINLGSLLKRELLVIAKEKNLQDISSKNTKAQIIAAIQSAN